MRAVARHQWDAQMNKAQLNDYAPVDAAELALRGAREKYLRAHGWEHCVDPRTSIWLWHKTVGFDRYTSATAETAVHWQVALLDAGTDARPGKANASKFAQLALAHDLAVERAETLATLLRQALDLVPRVDDDDPMVPALLDWCRQARAHCPQVPALAKSAGR
jgi:hypothetical protein